MDAAGIRRELAAALTTDDLERAFRRLSKSTHPDTAGGDGTAFLILQDEYDVARRRLSTSPVIHVPEPASEEVFDPYEIFAELGYGRPTEPRMGLYLALYRYHSANLGSRRIRTNQSLKRRNRTIFASVLWWGKVYDPDFPAIFMRYDKVQVESLKPTAYLKAGGDARRALQEGFDRFIRYQEEARSGMMALARHRLETAVDSIDVYGLAKDGIRDFAQWLLHELELPSLQLDMARVAQRRRR